AVGEAVHGLVFLEAVLLEAQALDHLVDLGPQDERDVAHAQKAAALRAVHLFASRVGNAVDDELPLAAGALEDFRDHGVSSEVYSRAPRPGPFSVPAGGGEPGQCAQACPPRAAPGAAAATGG